MYVKRLDRVHNRVEIAPRPGVMSRQCSLREVHWVYAEPSERSFTCSVRPRYRAKGSLAKVECHGSGEATVFFEEDQFALAPGQAAVFYEGNEVLGGGWIEGVSV